MDTKDRIALGSLVVATIALVPAYIGTLRSPQTQMPQSSISQTGSGNSAQIGGTTINNTVIQQMAEPQVQQSVLTKYVESWRNGVSVLTGLTSTPENGRNAAPTPVISSPIQLKDQAAAALTESRAGPDKVVERVGLAAAGVNDPYSSLHPESSCYMQCVNGDACDFQTSEGGIHALRGAEFNRACAGLFLVHGTMAVMANNPERQIALVAAPGSRIQSPWVAQGRGGWSSDSDPRQPCQQGLPCGTVLLEDVKNYFASARVISQDKLRLRNGTIVAFRTPFGTPANFKDGGTSLRYGDKYSWKFEDDGGSGSFEIASRDVERAVQMPNDVDQYPTKELARIAAMQRNDLKWELTERYP